MTLPIRGSSDHLLPSVSAPPAVVSPLDRSPSVPSSDQPPSDGFFCLLLLQWFLRLILFNSLEWKLIGLAMQTGLVKDLSPRVSQWEVIVRKQEPGTGFV